MLFTRQEVQRAVEKALEYYEYDIPVSTDNIRDDVMYNLDKLGITQDKKTTHNFATCRKGVNKHFNECMGCA
jgi:hypothetical protein